MTKEKYFQAINAAELAGHTHLADVLLMLCLKDYPELRALLRP